MIMRSSDGNLAGPGVKGDCGLVTFVQGGVHLTMFSSSLFVALRVEVSHHRHKVRSSRAFLAYMPAPAAKETLSGFIVWGDITPEEDVVPAYWELGCAMRALASHATFVLLQELFMSVVQGIVAQRDVGNESIEASGNPPLTSLDQRISDIPRIIVTPPDEDSSASLNAVPGPQDAAFGNQLIVPDLEFKVINRPSPEDPFSDEFRAEDPPPTHPAGATDAEDPHTMEVRDRVTRCAYLDDEDEDDEDVTAFELGPTWSG